MTGLQTAGGLWGTRLCMVSIYLTAIGAILALAAGPGYRAGIIGVGAGLLTYVAVSLAMLFATIAASVGLAMTKGSADSASQAITWVAFFAALLVTVNNVVWLNRARTAPPIHDITTDLNQPPEFVAILPLRSDAPNPAEYAGDETADLQRDAYPDVETIVVLDPAGIVFDSALAVAGELGWEIVDSNAQAGRIEATDTTAYFGFKDDVVIRIGSEGPQTRIDVRSKSRVGIGDVGTNANRIRRFRERLLEVIGS